MTQLSDWLKCAQCGYEDELSVKQVLGLGNFSLNLQCSCGFRHVERDPKSDNWDKSIRFKQMITGRNRKAPKISNTVQKMTRCPNCSSEDVDAWIYSENAGLDTGDTVGHVRLDCTECSAHQTTSVSH